MKCTECPHRKIVDGDECNLTREVCKLALLLDLESED